MAENEVERFILERRKRGEEAWCPAMRATISQQECVRRHTRQHENRWYGKLTDALATPQDRACNACPVGKALVRALHAKRFRNVRRLKGGKTWRIKS